MCSSKTISSICLYFCFLGFFIAAGMPAANAQSTSWKGTTNTSWTTASNWTNGVPTATVNAIIGDASFTNTANQPIIGGTANCKSLTIGGSVNATLTANKNLTINGDLLIKRNSTLVQAPVTLTIYGNWTNSGTFTPQSTLSGSTRIYAITSFAGDDEIISGDSLSSFMTVNIFSPAKVSLNTNIAITNSLSLNGTLDPLNEANAVLGDSKITVRSVGVLKIYASTLEGNYNNSALSLTGGSTVEYASTTVNQTINTLYAYSTLKISGTGVKSLTANLRALVSTADTVGNIYVTSGTLDLGNFTAARGTTVTGGVFSVSNGAILKIGGTKTFPASYNTRILDAASTVEYNGNNQTISAQDYGNLTLSGTLGAITKTMPATALTIAGNFVSNIGAATSVTFTAASNISVGGNATLENGVTFIAGNFTHTIAGNFTINGRLTGGTSTIILSGNSTSLSGSGTLAFNNLTISGNSVTATTAAIALTGNLTISGSNATANVTNITLSGNLITAGSGSFSQLPVGKLTMSGAAKTITGSAISLDTLAISSAIAVSNSVPTRINSSLAPLVNHLVLSAGTGTIFTIQGESLRIKGTMRTSGGKIAGADGKVEFVGTALQTIPSGIFVSNRIGDLIISNSAGVTNSGSLRLLGLLGFGNVNSSIFTPGSNFVFGSSDTATGILGDLTNNGVNSGNRISGTVTVERYTSAKRAYRFLTSSVNTSSTIRTNWMENSNNTSTSVNINPVPGYGIHITGAGGTANGFDETSTNNSSMFTFNNVTQAWTAIANTSGTFKAGTAYRVLIRGNRSTNLSVNDPTATSAILRSKGALVTGVVKMAAPGGGGTSGMPLLSPDVNGYSLIGNPYASPVDWNQLVKVNVYNSFYVFDPTISGTNGRGAYVTYNGTLGSNNNSESKVDNNIQPGQSFFAITTATGPSITYSERYKTSPYRAVFKTLNNTPRLAVQLLLPSQKTSGAADGLVVYFSNEYSAVVGSEDSYKLTNLDENIAIDRAGNILSLEGRKAITANDTIPLKIWQLSQKNYSLKITTANLPANVQAFLEDAFLNTSTALTGNSQSVHAFAITSNTASAAANRFRIVFKATQAAITMMKFANAQAYPDGNRITLQWVAENQTGIKSYIVEKSGDLKTFVSVNALEIKADNNAFASYTSHDDRAATGDQYYRIKALDKLGGIRYSQVLKVNVDASSAAITAFETGVRTGSINVIFRNLEKGKYSVSLVNTSGEVVYNAAITHNGGTTKYTLQTKVALAAGIYHIQAIKGNASQRSSLLIK